MGNPSCWLRRPGALALSLNLRHWFGGASWHGFGPTGRWCTRPGAVTDRPACLACTHPRPLFKKDRLQRSLAPNPLQAQLIVLHSKQAEDAFPTLCVHWGCKDGLERRRLPAGWRRESQLGIAGDMHWGWRRRAGRRRGDQDIRGPGSLPLIGSGAFSSAIELARVCILSSKKLLNCDLACNLLQIRLAEESVRMEVSLQIRAPASEDSLRTEVGY